MTWPPQDLLHALRRQLAAERARLLDRARALLASETGAELGDDGADHGDRQDRARQERDRQAALHLSRADQERLAEVEAALARMDAGTYGLCEDTGEPIPAERLRAMPTARRTIEAQELAEDTPDDPTRPDLDEGY